MCSLMVFRDYSPSWQDGTAGSGRNTLLHTVAYQEAESKREVGWALSHKDHPQRPTSGR